MSQNNLKPNLSWSAGAGQLGLVSWCWSAGAGQLVLVRRSDWSPHDDTMKDLWPKGKCMEYEATTLDGYETGSLVALYEWPVYDSGVVYFLTSAGSRLKKQTADCASVMTSSLNQLLSKLTYSEDRLTFSSGCSPSLGGTRKGEVVGQGEEGWDLSPRGSSSATTTHNNFDYDETYNQPYEEHPTLLARKTATNWKPGNLGLNFGSPADHGLPTPGLSPFVRWTQISVRPTTQSPLEVYPGTHSRLGSSGPYKSQGGSAFGASDPEAPTEDDYWQELLFWSDRVLDNLYTPGQLSLSLFWSF
ncbi:hypothetical protein FHG87_013063 [Trinorchestia longiramus]|nr:hypothetical protein FHG87_013063 [Trinorchestia longiramus]